MEAEEEQVTNIEKKSTRALSPFTRGLIIGLYISGKEYKEIEDVLKENNKRGCLKSIQNICDQWQSDGQYQTNYANCGRNKIMNDNSKQQLISYISENPEKSRKQLEQSKEANPLNLSGQTLVNYIKDENYKRLVQPRKIYISEENKVIRINWCKNMLRCGKRILNNAIYSDESWLYYQQTHKQYIWVKDESEILPDQIQYVKNWPQKVMIWAAIHKSGPLSIQFIEDNLNSDNYYQILETFFLEEENNQFKDSYFQQDNAKPHKTDQINKFFQKNEIQLLDWPSQSPDISPIEKVWFTMKNILNQQINQIQSFDEFKKAIKNIFLKNSKVQDSIRKNIERIPNILNDIIQNKGNIV